MAEREYNFGPGNPDPGVFPAEDLGAAAQRVLNRLGTAGALSRPTRFARIARGRRRALRAQPGHSAALEDIVITNGAMQSLVLSAQGWLG
jgi:DNA-binding transcriptional MocR family regulator